MASIDKAAIGFTIGIVAVAVAIAGMGGNLQSGTSPSLAMAPVVTQQEMPVEPEVAKEIQKTMEDIMEQQRQGATEEPEPAPILVTPPKVEDVPTMTGPQIVSVPTGTAVPGCEETNQCYIPATISISVGDTVSWSNDDTAAHTVTSGSPTEGPDGSFDSSLFMAGTTFDVTFDTAGSYDYFCMVHPWMVGIVQVS